MSVVLLGGKLTNTKKSERPLVEGGLAVKPTFKFVLSVQLPLQSYVRYIMDSVVGGFICVFMYL